MYHVVANQLGVDHQGSPQNVAGPSHVLPESRSTRKSALDPARPRRLPRFKTKYGTLQDNTTTISRPWLTSAWKPSHIQALSLSSHFWPFPRNGYLFTSNQVHCGKEKPISSIYWWQHSSFVTPVLATRTLEASLTTGARTSRPKMNVHAWQQRFPQDSGTVGNVKCRNRHVPITARPANGRFRIDRGLPSRSISDKTLVAL
jgi:hypothetical protein